MSKQLIHSDPRFFNSSLSIPHDGVVKVGPKGEVTVSERAARVLLTIPHWEDPEKEEETEQESKTGGKLVFEPAAGDSGLSGFDFESLDGFDTAELLEVAAAADLKVPVPMRTNKKSLTTFLRNALKKKLATK
jgi:hypothetical protein